MRQRAPGCRRATAPNVLGAVAIESAARVLRREPDAAAGAAARRQTNATTASASPARPVRLAKAPELVAEEADRGRDDDGHRRGHELGNAGHLDEPREDHEVDGQREPADREEPRVLVMRDAMADAE